MNNIFNTSSNTQLEWMKDVDALSQPQIVRIKADEDDAVAAMTIHVKAFLKMSLFNCLEN